MQQPVVLTPVLSSILHKFILFWLVLQVM